VESNFFIKGLIAGFLICAPFGPIGLLCVRRTLMDGKLAGVASVLGASVVDALYCAIAGLGISYIANFLRNEHPSPGGWRTRVDYHGNHRLPFSSLGERP